MTDLFITIVIEDIKTKNKINNYKKSKIIWNNPQNALNDIQNIQRKIKPYPASATLEC